MERGLEAASGRPRKCWKSCILEDAANFTGVKNIDIKTINCPATVMETDNEMCVMQATPTTRRRHFYVACMLSLLKHPVFAIINGCVALQ